MRVTRLTAPLACGGDESAALPTATVELARIERIVVATGTVEPEREVEVRPRIAGIIQKIHVEPGDIVKEGQLLLEIERDLLESHVREAEAALREAMVEQRYAKIELARSQDVPPYVVAADRTLRDVALLRPRTREELLLCHGIGPAKSEKYGDGLLAVVRDAARP